MLDKVKPAAIGARPASVSVNFWQLDGAEDKPSQFSRQLIRAELIGSDTCTALGITSRSSIPVLEMCHRSGSVMTAAVAIKHINLLDAFIERAEARAYLWSIGELTLHEAVDVLQADAERDGLIEQIGQDRIQKILAECFASYRYGEPDAEI